VAYDAFQDAAQFRDRISRFGINHEIPQHFFEDFEYSKSVLLKDLYEKGSSLMAERRFDEAKVTFSKLAKIDPSYKDVAELKGVARNEPLYMAATSHFDEGRYRQAYREFDEVYRNDPNYRDAAVLRQECLNLGQYPVALSPFENTSGVRGIEKRVYAFFVTSLTQINDPFLRIIERDNMEMILAEQRLSLSGIVDQNTALQVGNLLGAKALVTANVLSYSTLPGKLRRIEKDGFEAYTVKLYNTETKKNYFETRYKPVKYSEYVQNNEARISVQYKAISLESGEVIFSHIVDKKEEDQMYYAAYDGEVNNLFPAGSNGVVTSNRERTRLNSLIRAPRTIRTVDELSNGAFAAAAEALSADLTKHLTEQ
jgi:tetratricopeptide (TPR) repeat protein